MDSHINREFDYSAFFSFLVNIFSKIPFCFFSSNLESERDCDIYSFETNHCTYFTHISYGINLDSHQTEYMQMNHIWTIRIPRYV